MGSHLDRLRAALEGVLAKASGEDLEKAPAGKWNSAQILEHLYLTYNGTNKGIAKCVAEGKPLATKASVKHRFRRLVVVGIGYMPGGAKAPERSKPKGMLGGEVRGTILAEMEKMAAGLDECEKRFGVRTKIIDHPILGPLTADEWRKFHWVHGRHHARQIRERVREVRSQKSELRSWK